MIRYYGQYIALAVADTFESAKAAADAVRATYTEEKPNVNPDLKPDDEPDVVETTRGRPNACKANAATLSKRFRECTGEARPDLCYADRNPQSDRTTGDDGDVGRLDADDLRRVAGNFQSSQRSCADVRAAEGKRARDHEICRLRLRQQAMAMDALCAGVAAARQLGKPVKLVISRKMMFQSVGHRPRTQQRVRLGATGEGKLVSLMHDYVNDSAMLDGYHENCGEATPYHYSVPNLRVKWGPPAAISARRRPCAVPAPCPDCSRPSRR